MSRPTGSHWQREIAAVLAAQPWGSEIAPRHVEAWMRLDVRTLDALSPAEFRGRVVAAAYCALMASAEQNDRLAESTGL